MNWRKLHLHILIKSQPCSIFSSTHGVKYPSSITEVLGDLGFAYESHWSRRLQVVGTFSRYLGSQLEVTSSGCGFFEAGFACLVLRSDTIVQDLMAPCLLASGLNPILGHWRMGYSIWCHNLPACANIHVETYAYVYICNFIYTHIIYIPYTLYIILY